jgi:hypothetical protein
MNWISKTLKILCATGLLVNCSIAQEANMSDPTIIRITDKVMVKDVVRLGLNHSQGDAYHDVQVRNTASACNFEGGLYRYIYNFGPKTADGRVTIKGLSENQFANYEGGSYTVISGPSKWTAGKILDIQNDLIGEGAGKTTHTLLQLDKAVETPSTAAIMLENMKQEGALPKSVRRGDKTRFVFGDTAPESFGSTALLLPVRSAGDADKEKESVRFFVAAQNRVNCNILWGVRFRAKAGSGKPVLRVSTGGFGDEKQYPLGSDWRLFEERFEVTKMRQPKDTGDMVYLVFEYTSESGEALIDDIEIWRADKKNPTVFTDEAVEAFQELRPGVLRALQGSDNTVLNTIMPAIRSRNAANGLHEFFELCDLVGAEPYWCLPSTLTREEITGFIEYLAAPADVGWGKIRAELGREKPWTDSLPGVCVEFGNELHNFGGFGGPDYWHDLIETGKKSPYYNSKIFFTMGAQGQALEHAKNMDGFSLGGYICWGFNKDDHEQYLNTDEKLFRWAQAYAIQSVVNPELELARRMRTVKELGVEPVMYEGSYHTNFGDGPNEPRNKLVTSIGGAVNYINRMLFQMREYGMRRQCYFATIGSGHKFSGTGAFGSEEAGYVRMWGSIVRLDADKRRFRPNFLALTAANNVMAGDMIETVHEGANPSFDITATFTYNLRDIKSKKKIEPVTYKDQPLVHSYAFADGKQRGLILVNLDLAQARPVEIQFDGKVAGGKARTWLLKADSPTANNEMEHEAQVSIEKAGVDAFASGKKIEIPACTMLSLQWELE